MSTSERGVDGAGRLVDDPVPGAVDHTEVQIRRQAASARRRASQVLADVRVTASPDAGDPRADGG
jgi:hypothetical protein